MLEERQCIPSDPNLITHYKSCRWPPVGELKELTRTARCTSLTSERMLVSSDSCDSTHLCDLSRLPTLENLTAASKKSVLKLSVRVFELLGKVVDLANKCFQAPRAPCSTQSLVHGAGQFQLLKVCGPRTLG